MSDDEPQSFIAYWDAVDAVMKRIAGLDTFDAGTGAEPISSAYENGWTTETGDCAAKISHRPNADLAVGGSYTPDAHKRRSGPRPGG